MTDEQLTDEERVQLELAIEVENYPIAKLLRLHDRLKARVEKLERFAALAILTHWDQEGQGGPQEPPEWPAAVKELTEQYNSYDVQHCERCGLWAPTQRPSHTCAPGWGCALKPPG